MAFDPINVGTAPNDNTGDANRLCWIKTNTMLGELYTALGLRATVEQFNGFVTSIGENFAALGAAIAGKAEATSVAGKADASTVPRFDQDAPLSDIQRLQLAKNTGSLVTLLFNLLDEDTALDLGAWTLPRIPDNFLLHSVVAVVHTSGGSRVSCNLKTLTNDVVATGNLVALPHGSNGARIELNLDAQNILAMNGLIFTVTQYEPGYTDTASFGLALWIRGLWK